MNKTLITKTLISTAVMMAFNVHAATSYMEARSDAMGGTGVASAHYGTAALSNPALLTNFGPTDDFSLVLPSVGVQVADPDNAVDTADDVKDLWNDFDNAVDNQSGIDQAAAALRNKLDDLKDVKANGQVGASVIATAPIRSYRSLSS